MFSSEQFLQHRDYHYLTVELADLPSHSTLCSTIYPIKGSGENDSSIEWIVPICQIQMLSEKLHCYAWRKLSVMIQ